MAIRLSVRSTLYTGKDRAPLHQTCAASVAYANPLPNNSALPMSTAMSTVFSRTVTNRIAHIL